MATSTSSAEPEKLFRYADVSAWADQELASASGRLRGILQSFEGSCTEYPVSVSHLAGSVQSHAQTAENFARWVYQVGEGFLAADSLSWLGRSVSGIYLVEAVPAPRSSPGLMGFTLRWPSLTLPPWLAALLRPFMRSLVSRSQTSIQIADLPVAPPVPVETRRFSSKEFMLTGEEGESVVWCPIGARAEILEEKISEKGARTVRVRLHVGELSYEGFAPKDAFLETTLVSRSPVGGEDVRPGIEDPGKLYGRWSNVSGLASNCTWYTAAAVAERSGGRLDTDALDWRAYPPKLVKVDKELEKEDARSLGNAWEWTTNARALLEGYEKSKVEMADRRIVGIDGKPREGDAICFSYGHVAYVEETWISNDGKTVAIVISEENYEGASACGAPSEQLDIPSAQEVRRFRRTLILENVGEKGNPPVVDTTKGYEFIHFNYDFGRQM